MSKSMCLCPNGCGRLTPFDAGSITLERCVTCAGVYLSKDLVDRIRRMPRAKVVDIDNAIKPASHLASVNARKRVDPRPCPNCQTLMLPFEVAGTVPVTLDKCGSCDGIWADDHELEAVSVDIGDEAVHFGRNVPVDVRNEMIRALYDETGSHKEGNPVEEAFAEIFPTFASWIRQTDHPDRESASPQFADREN